MQQHRVIKAMLGGLLGTLGQLLLVYGVAPLMAGQALELSVVRNLPCALGLMLHILSGSVLFPLGYLAVPPHDMPGPPVLKGIFWAGLLWGVTESLMAPLLGAAVFSAALGGLPAALRALAGYLVYGATLGGIVGAQRPRTRRLHDPGEGWDGGSLRGRDKADVGTTRARAGYRPCWRQL